MAIMILTLLLCFILSLILFIGIVFLQILLSRSENKWVGLVLPILSFLVSLIYPLNMATYTAISINIVNIILALLVTNIPTLILLFVYFVYRKKQNKKKQIEKMNIQDL